MMPLLILIVLNLILAGFDAYVTSDRIRNYGINIELNPAIRFLARKLGPDLAALLGVLIPAVGSIALCALLKWVLVLALLAGFRLRMAVIQWQSIILGIKKRI